MEKVLRKFSSFEEQERFEEEYWKSLNPVHKLEILESIRSATMGKNNDDKRGLQRVLRIIDRE